jgi:hypothetical protein
MDTTQLTTDELLQLLVAQVEDLKAEIKLGRSLGWGKCEPMTVHCSRHHGRWYEWIEGNEKGKPRHIEKNDLLCQLKGIDLFEAEFEGKITHKADIYVDAGEPVILRASVYTATGKCLLGPILKLTPGQRCKPIGIEAVHETQKEKVLLMNVKVNGENLIFNEELPRWEQLQSQVNQLNTEMGFTLPERKEKKEGGSANKQKLIDAMDRLKVAKTDRLKIAKQYLPSGKTSDQCTNAEIDAAIAKMDEELAEF